MALIVRRDGRMYRDCDAQECDAIIPAHELWSTDNAWRIVYETVTETVFNYCSTGCQHRDQKARGHIP